MANKIQVRRGTKAQITAAGPFAAGEPVYALDTRELVIGNGTGANTPVVTATSADISYYVRTDGNDNNTGLANTAAGAFKTIGKAISMIPQVVNHTVAVNVAAGTYAEAILIEGTSGKGYVAFVGLSVIIQSFTAARCNRVTINGFTANSTSGIAFNAYDGGMIDITSCIVTASSDQPGIAIQGQRGTVNSSTVSNRSIGIFSANATVFSNGNSGTGNTNGLYANESGSIHKLGTQPTGTMLEGVNGGIITAGVVNPWGDNTTGLRATVWAYRAGSNQSITASTFTRIVFDGEAVDNLGEYNPAIGVFTAANSGWYLIKARLLCQAVPNGAELFSRLVYNTSTYRDIGMGRATGIDIAIDGFILLKLNPGDTLEVQLYSSSATAVIASSQFTRLEIIRLS